VEAKGWLKLKGRSVFYGRKEGSNVAVVTLDVTGEMCPIPIVKSKIRLKRMSRGDVLLVISDHSCAAQSLVEHMLNLGYPTTMEEPAPGLWHIRIVVP